MKVEKFLDDPTKKRKISISEIPFVAGVRIARINSLKFSGKYCDSPNGEFWLACCDEYVLKKNPCYFGQGNQILLFGEGQKPSEGKVANNGTFIINDMQKNDPGPTFYAFDKDGNTLIQHRLEGMWVFAENGISKDGNYAVCYYGKFLYFFNLCSRSLKWSLVPECSHNGTYLFDCEKKHLHLQWRDGQSYRYDFEGNFLDKEKWEEDKIAYATATELYYIVKDELSTVNTPISQDKSDTLVSYLNRALTAKELDYDRNFKAHIYEMFGEVYETQNEIDLAIEYYKWAISLEPRHKANIYRKLGEIFESQYATEKAIENYEIALHLNPKVGVKKKLAKLNKIHGG